VTAILQKYIMQFCTYVEFLCKNDFKCQKESDMGNVKAINLIKQTEYYYVAHYICHSRKCA